MAKSLSLTEVLALRSGKSISPAKLTLVETKLGRHKTWNERNEGPVKFFEKAKPCYAFGQVDCYEQVHPSDKGCKAPTRLRIRGVPYCHIHAVLLLNHLLVEAGVTE